MVCNVLNRQQRHLLQKNNMTSLIRPLTFALITLAIGLGFAFYLVEYEARLEHEDAATRFNTLSERAINQLKTRIQLYEYGLKGGEGDAGG